MRVADLVIEAILEAGCESVFSLSGNQIMSVYDAALDQDIRLIHCRHEAAAVFMADGYARMSGRTGVALVTAGPGFCNALGPLFSLKSSESPVLLISGDSPLAMDGRKPFQELDQTSASAGLVKESWRLTQSENVKNAIFEAIHLTRSGRPGPVHLAFPEDLLDEIVQRPLFREEPLNLEDEIGIHQPDLMALTKLLDESEKPLIVTGPSLSPSRHPELIAAMASRHNIPVICFAGSRGLKDPTLGRVKSVLAEADGLILLDKDPDFTLGFGAQGVIGAEKIVVAASHSATVSLSHEVFSGRLRWGCIAPPLSTLEKLVAFKLKKRSRDWLRHVRDKCAERPPGEAESDALTPLDIMAAFGKAIRPEAPPLVVSDGGEFGQWVQAFLPHPEVMLGRMITNGLSGGIGGALPQGIGASIANPGQRVVVFSGDGSAGFHLPEIETARRLGLPVTMIIGNDQRWGAEAEIQKTRYGADRIHACGLDAETRYDVVAEGFGAKGFHVTSRDEIDDVLNAALASDGTNLVNIAMTGKPAPAF